MQYKIITVLLITIFLYLFCVMWKYFKYQKPSNKEKINNIIKTLVRQSARWSVAASQDTNIMIAVLHSNYGAGYLWVLN